MKLMQRDASNLDKARRAERKAEEKSGLITIKPMKLEGSTAKGGFKKGGFKSAFGNPKMDGQEDSDKLSFEKVMGGDAKPDDTAAVRAMSEDSEDEDPDYDYYDPRNPTGCNGNCGFTAN
jgi:hypothetical protein